MKKQHILRKTLVFRIIIFIAHGILDGLLQTQKEKKFLNARKVTHGGIGVYRILLVGEGVTEKLKHRRGGFKGAWVRVKS